MTTSCSRTDDRRAGRRHRLRRRRADPRARIGGLLARGDLPQTDRGTGGMMSQFKAELLKIRSTRTTLGLVLGLVALIVLFSLLTGLASNARDLVTTEDQREALGVGSFEGVFSALAGIML